MLENNNSGNLQSPCSSKKKKKTVGCGRIQIDCTCTKNSTSLSSSSKDPRSTQRKKPKTCKSCGGKLAEHGPKSRQGRMVRNEGLKLLKYIDPHLNWKRPPNGKPRTRRKARTSFTGPNVLSVELKRKLSKKSRDMSIAESEKVGVNILGRRFSDSLWSVPLKKRKHLSPDSLSSPYQATLKSKQKPINKKLDSLLEESGTDENLGIADFSGISLLAAAACDSITRQASLEFHGSLKANAQLVLSPIRNDRQLPQTSEDLGGTKDLPLDASSSSALYGEKSNEVKSDSSVKIFTNVSCKTLEFTSKEVKFPWDLNAAIDENAEQESTYSGCENDGFDVHQTSFGEAKNVHNNLRNVENREISNCEADMKHDISCYSQTEESKVSKIFPSHHTNTLAIDSKCDSEDCKEAKQLINQNSNDTVPKVDKDSTLVTEIDLTDGNSPINRNMNNNIPEATIGSEIDTIEEKAEASSVLSRLKVETEKPPSHLASCGNALSKSHFRMDDKLVKAIGSLSPDQKSSYVDASFYPEERRPMVLVSKNIFDKGTGCMIHVANSDTDTLAVAHPDNSVKCREYDTSEFELSNETKLDAIDCDNMVTTKKDFSISSMEEQLPVYVNKVEDYVGNHCQTAVENHIEYHNDSDLSQVNNNGYDYYCDDDDQGDETGKLEFLPDDDSQYEDGELRETPTNFWVGEVAEEDGSEMVGYGLNVDTNTYNATSDLSSYQLPMNPLGISNAISMTRKAISKSFDGANKLCSPSSYRRMPGWGHLPDTCRKSLNNINKDEGRYYSKSSFHDSTDRAKPSIYRDVSSQSDISTKNENLYIRRSRSSERNDFKPRVEMQRVDPRTLGRNISSMHSQGRGRSDHWARPSPKYHSNNQHDSFDCRSSRNAAAAAIAKIESSGFVVAPDGTIVKCNRPRPTKDCSYQYKCNTSISRKSPTGKAREISPDRSTFVRSGNAEGNGYKMEAVSTFSPMQHLLPRKIRVFSPPRRHFPLSRSPLRSKRRFSLSRSPSRSRTRSPHRWVSPRDRSPNFNIGSRVNRPRTDFGEDVIYYGSLPRNYASPPPAARPRTSRWNNGKKVFDNYREYRGETYGRGFDNGLSYGRGRQGGFSSSTNFRRFHETFRRNDDDDTRKPVYVNNDNMKRSWNNDRIGFIGQNTRQKALEFQKREEPRNLDRDSPRRPREEQGGHYRVSRGGNYDAGAKSFDVRDVDESQ